MPHNINNETKNILESNVTELEELISLVSSNFESIIKDFKCYDICSKLEIRCQNVCTECQKIKLWIQRGIVDLKNKMKFEDYSQSEMRTLNDYPSIVVKCKVDLKKKRSELENKLKEILMEETIL